MQSQQSKAFGIRIAESFGRRTETKSSRSTLVALAPMSEVTTCLPSMRAELHHAATISWIVFRRVLVPAQAR